MTATIGLVPNKPKTPVTAIRIPLELKAQVMEKAAAEGTNLSAIVNAALTRYVKRSK